MLPWEKKRQTACSRIVLQMIAKGNSDTGTSSNTPYFKKEEKKKRHIQTDDKNVGRLITGLSINDMQYY